MSQVRPEPRPPGQGRGHRTSEERPHGPATEYSTWVEVDLDAVRGNVAAALAAVAARTTGPEPAAALMAVVKADGYGHGASPVARAALAGGATWLGVARAEEALQLRGDGVSAPVLLLGHVPPGRVADLVAAGISLTVWDPDQLHAVSRCAAGLLVPARVHLKIDTGMTRVGARPAQAVELARLTERLDHVELQGVFTHLARADEVDDPDGVRVTADQLAALRAVVVELAAAGLRPPLVHAANSAATLAVRGAGLDLVRFGIAMYGLSPGAAVTLPPTIRPALTWKSVLAQVKDVPPGRGVSYGHIYTTRRAERIGTVPVGYADGWRRTGGNEVLVAGRRVPVVGRVCMDQCMVNLDAVPDARPGEEVVLIGAQDQEVISADDVAARWGTIGYEVVCGIGRRVPRLYRGIGPGDTG